MRENMEKLNGNYIKHEVIEPLKNIDGICIDTSKTREQKMLLFVKEIENPYYFLCGNTPVRICFLDEGVDLRNRLLSYFTGLK